MNRFDTLSHIPASTVQNRLGRVMVKLSLLCALVLPTVASAQDANGVCRVTVDGTDVGTGATWASPKNLQSALGDIGCVEIWVAAGVYLPTSDGNREISFLIRSGFQVYGGFAGTETTRDQRNVRVNETVLSGDIGTECDHGDNSLHVVYMDGRVGPPILVDTVLDGFTITRGNADGSGSGILSDIGGGLFCDGSFGPGSECSPTLRQLIFLYNQASGEFGGRGGGLANYGRLGISSPTLIDVLFLGNTASIQGPGVALGGAMLNSGDSGISNPVLIDVTFRLNSVTANATTSSAFGGALYNDGSSGQSSPVLTNVTFEDNSATGADARAGGMYNHGFLGVIQPQLINVTFSGNSASGVTFGARGGAMYNDAFSGASNISLTNVTIANNSANGDVSSTRGGGIYVNGTDGNDETRLSNTIVWGNSAPQDAQIANSNASVVFDHGIVQGACPAGVTCTDISTVDPQLGPLADNGGPTRTLAIPADSSAVDTGSAETCPDTDQRGIPRPQLEGCDIGAVEYVSIDEDTIFRDGFDVPPVQAPSASTGNHSREVEPIACVISGISSSRPW